MDVTEFEEKIQDAATLLKAMSNERRLEIICALYKGEKSVTELESIVGLSQSALSQHLARLRRDDIVKTRRDAQTIYYSLGNQAVEAILYALCKIYNQNDPSACPPTS
jgi:DNA-binding transcriptional ArsR family regulator